MYLRMYRLSRFKAYKEQKKQYAKDLEAWKASKPARATYSAPAPAPRNVPVSAEETGALSL